MTRVQTYKKRAANIELLRILAIIAVIILHYKSPGNGGGLNYVAVGSTSYYLLFLLESVCVCAVDLFMLISGFFLCSSEHRDLRKPTMLIIQVSSISCLKYLIQSLLSGNISMRDLLFSAIPSNYFVILYCAVFLISPYINRLLRTLCKRDLRNFIILLVCVFSVYPTLVDLFSTLSSREWMGLSTIGIQGSQWGYTIVTFSLMYILGAYMKFGDCRIRKWSVKKLVAVLVLCIVGLTLWALAGTAKWDSAAAAWYYNNPVVIFLAMLYFELFSRLHIPEGHISKMVLNAARAVFTIFLTHNIFFRYINIPKYAAAGPVIMLLHIVTSCLGISLIGYVLDLIYHKISDPILQRIFNKISLPCIDLEDAI